MSLYSGKRVFVFLLFFSIFPALSVADGPSSSPTTDKDKKPTVTDVYEPGGDVKSPKLVHYVEPAFSHESKEAFIEGVVKIVTVVTTDGQSSEARVVSGLNAEEDRTALEALKQWRFQPGTKDGKPVKVKVTIEVAFHLL